MKITPRQGAGADVEGAALCGPSAGDLAAIKAAFADHGVLFFSQQDTLCENGHKAFAEMMGEINVNRFFAAHPDHPEIAMVAKEPDDTANIGGGWHTDHSYDREPAMGSVLVARVLPPEGGDTRFCDMADAFDALDDATKDEISGLRAVHSGKHIFGSQASYYKGNDAGQGRIGNRETADQLDDVTHPVVIRHPLSGRSVLYVNPAFTTRFEGQTAEESRPLLHKLFAHAMQPRFHTQHSWRRGDVAMWDNRSTWHWALNDYHGHRRVMHRITVEGCPLEAAA